MPGNRTRILSASTKNFVAGRIGQDPAIFEYVYTALTHARKACVKADVEVIGFELWAIAPGATQPRSLGVVSPNGELKLSRLLADLRDGATLAISFEPIGCSPTQLPSGPVVYIGSVNAV